MFLGIFLYGNDAAGPNPLLKEIKSYADTLSLEILLVRLFILQIILILEDFQVILVVL